jgi:regulator of CtrA degradation
MKIGIAEEPSSPSKCAFAFFSDRAEDFGSARKGKTMSAVENEFNEPERAVPFFGRTYDETMELLLSARHYVASIQPGEFSQIEPGERLNLNCEALRLTTRLAQVMAWLLAQKAVAAGEITRAQAQSDAYRLGAHTLCLADTDARVAANSKKLGALMSQSRLLFERVARLDRQIDG